MRSLGQGNLAKLLAALLLLTVIGIEPVAADDGVAPSNLVAVATSPTTALITFDEGAQKTAVPWLSYTAVSVPGGITSTLIVSELRNSERVIFISGLTPSTSYQFKMFGTSQDNTSTGYSGLSNSITTFASYSNSGICNANSTAIGNETILTFTSSISTTAGCRWRVPADVNSLSIFGVGGGGGGGGAFLEPQIDGTTFIGQGAGGGGGGGLSFSANNISVTPGQFFNVRVGTGGSGGAHVYSDNPADAIRNGRADNGGIGGLTYFGDGTINYYGKGGIGGHGGGGNGSQNRPNLGGDGGGSDQFTTGLNPTDDYQSNSINTCLTTPSVDANMAPFGCSFWEGGGGGLGAGGYPTVQYLSPAGTNNLSNPVAYYVSNSITYYTANDRPGAGATGGSGGPGVTSSLSGSLTYYGGGGGGGGNTAEFTCPGLGGISSTLGGLGSYGGGNGATCADAATPVVAAAGIANTGGGGGGGGIVTTAGVVIDINSGDGAAGGSGILIIRYVTPIISVPDPVQTDSITGITPTGGFTGTEVLVTGSFGRAISKIFVGNVELLKSEWTQTGSTIKFKMPPYELGKVNIQIYNGAAPVLKSMQFEYLPIPIVKQEKVVPPKLPQKICVRGKLTFLPKTQKCPSGYVSKSN